jgi:hypothetical protein
MSKPAISLTVYAIYLGIGGALVALFPHVMLSLIGLPQTNEVWIRFFGALAVALAAKGFDIARRNTLPSIQFDVYVRTSVATFITVLVIMSVAPPITILLAILEYLGAAWTQAALWAERKQHHPATA